MKVGSKYVGCGKGVRVRVIRTNPFTGEKVAVVEWSSNGQLPRRQCDSLIYESSWKHYTEVN